MKKILLVLSIFIVGITVAFAQYATDFTANDCDGNPHNLFTELDEGKVIVIAWVMPCATCIADPLDALVTVNSYSSSHPDRVHFYLVDDFADNTCQTLSTWANNFGMKDCIKFSDPTIDMFDYGFFGMPKIVVLGSSDHLVYFEKNNSSEGISDAIDLALDGVNIVGREEYENSLAELKTFPNPAINELTVKYDLKNSTMIKLEVIDASGKTVRIKDYQEKAFGPHEYRFDVSTLNNGIYFIKLTSNNGIETVRFNISR